MSNADKIRNMTDKKLAEYIAREQINAITMFLAGFDDDLLKDFFDEISLNGGKIEKEKLEWLKKEAT